MYSRFFIIFTKKTLKSALLLSAYLLLNLSAAQADTLQLVQDGEAYTGREVTLSLSGTEAYPDAAYEWSFSGSARPISLRKGATQCVLTPVDTSPLHISVAAVAHDRNILAKADLTIKAREFTVNIITSAAKPVLLWDSAEKKETQSDKLAVNEPVSFRAELDPPYHGEIKYQWKTDASAAILSDNSSQEFTVSRSEIGEFEISVSAFNNSGVLLGQFRDNPVIAISSSDIQTSKDRKNAWAKWLDAKSAWEQKNYTAAIKGAKEAYELDKEAPEIAGGLNAMLADFARIERALQIMQKVQELKKSNNLSEALKTCRRAAIVWETPESASAIRELEEEINSLRLKRQEKEWLLDTASAYDQEGLFSDALNFYKKSQEFEPSKEVQERIERISKRLTDIGEADKLLDKGIAAEKDGKITEALEFYKKSLQLDPKQELKVHSDELERTLTARKNKAAALFKEGAELQKKHKDAEALLRYQESQLLWPDSDTQKRITDLARTEKKSPSGALRKPEDFGIGTKADAARLLNEADALYKAGKYNEALALYRKSHAISKDSALLVWIQRIEASLKEYDAVSKANAIIKEANSLYNMGKIKEACAKYKESQQINFNQEVAAFIKQLEASVLSSDVSTSAPGQKQP